MSSSKDTETDWLLFHFLEYAIPQPHSMCNNVLIIFKHPLKILSGFFFPPNWVVKKCKLYVQDGGLPFARSLKDVHSEFRLLCKLSELLLKEGQHQEALQYATLAVQISTSTGNKVNFLLKFHHLMFWQRLL